MSKKLIGGVATFTKEEYDNHQKSLLSKKEWPGVNINTGTV